MTALMPPLSEDMVQAQVGDAVLRPLLLPFVIRLPVLHGWLVVMLMLWMYVRAYWSSLESMLGRRVSTV